MDINDKMRLTLALAKDAMDQGEFPIASIVFLDDEIIAQSYTSENLDGRFLVHAELKALIEADKKKYSYFERKRMQLFTNLEPCMMCLGAAMTFFIGQVFYSLDSPTDGAVRVANEWDPQSEYFPGYRVPQIHGGILVEESRQLFAEFIEITGPGPMSNFAKSLISGE